MADSFYTLGNDMDHGGNPRLLEMTHIEKSFSSVKVLEDVSFDLNSGEVHILAGENGAGKSTLIKILAGVHTEYTGSIVVQGEKVGFKSPQDAATRGISAIHQEMSLVNAMSVSDNIFLGRELTKRGGMVDFGRQREQAGSLLSQLDLSVDLTRAAEDYPVSVRQMIEIAKALAYDSRIIIMDEPTSALSDVEANRLFTIISQLKERGCGIIYISHRLEEIYRIADRITVLRDGKFIGTADAADLPQDRLINWMVGRDITQQFPNRAPQLGETCLEVRDFAIHKKKNGSGAGRGVVEDIGFDLREGEILGIAGLQGSGKSELLHGLFGSQGKSTQGEVSLKGREFNPHSPRHSILQGLVLLTNDRANTGLIPGLDITENVSLASLKALSRLGWMKTKRLRAAAVSGIEAFNIKANSPEQEVRTLSGGNQQKVVLAKWLETKPDVLLLDEPTIGVDVGAKHEIYQLMNSWTDQGMGILLITSELPELLAMSDRILVMHRGKIVQEFPRNEADQEKILRAAMGKRSDF
jgi:ribose transport system ATP-binding protein